MGLLDAIKDKQFREDLADNGLNFLKSASNAVAGNVTGPVDAISWALRKAGLPIPDAPLGGSNWAKNAGLLSDVQHNPSAIAGETFGLLAPVGMTAGAPKIAKGLLQVADNAAAPRMMNPETGAIVWHGSPHKFDKFDSSKIGTGEGAQAYGHGIYTAEAPDVAQSYADALGYDYKYMGKIPKEGSPNDVAIRYLKLNQWDKEAAKSGFKSDGQGAVIRDAIDKLNIDRVQKPGNLYKVDLPDEHIAKMLDWDKPLSQQHPDVQSVLLKHPDVLDQMQKAEAQRVLLNERSPMRLDKIPSASIPYDASRMAGKDALTAIQQRSGLGVTGGVEQQLRQAGIPGIRYLDGGSRGTGAGTSNFVVFPGNEGLLQILERNGQPIK